MEKNKIDVQLENKVMYWISQQGYPLEFKTANIFRDAGFNAHQGIYVNDYKLNIPKEIDVMVKFKASCYGSNLNINLMVECKYTAEKPWVIFSDKISSIAEDLLVTQTIATNGAKVVLDFLSDNKNILNLRMYKLYERKGFNGIQSLAKNNNDLVYNTLRSITSCSFSHIYKVNSHTNAEEAINNLTINYPIIVIDGNLYESYYDKFSNKIKLEEKKTMQLHWKGAENWQHPVIIDIVTIDELPEYSKSLFTDIHDLVTEFGKVLMLIKESSKEKSIEKLKKAFPNKINDDNVPDLIAELTKSLSPGFAFGS